MLRGELYISTAQRGEARNFTTPKIVILLKTKHKIAWMLETDIKIKMLENTVLKAAPVMWNAGSECSLNKENKMLQKLNRSGSIWAAKWTGDEGEGKSWPKILSVHFPPQMLPDLLSSSSAFFFCSTFQHQQAFMNPYLSSQLLQILSHFLFLFYVHWLVRMLISSLALNLLRPACNCYMVIWKCKWALILF